MDKKPAKIALFAFNRADLLSRTLTALAANTLASESHITIFCDGPRSDEEQIKTDAVRTVAHTAQGFASVTVIERERNYGCAASIIDGLRYMFARYERLIVIEDDILTSPYTLKFLNDGLEFYDSYKTVFNISAWSPPAKIFPLPKEYSYDVYAIPRLNCWGWASWRDRFERIDWDVSDYEEFRKSKTLRNAFNIGGEDMSPMLDAQMEGKLNTWAIRADYARFKQGQVGINPVISYTTNIGMGSGTHCLSETDKYDNDIKNAKSEYIFNKCIFIDKKVLLKYQKVYNKRQFVYNFISFIIKRTFPQRYIASIKKIKSKLKYKLS